MLAVLQFNNFAALHLVSQVTHCPVSHCPISHRLFESELSTYFFVHLVLQPIFTDALLCFSLGFGLKYAKTPQNRPQRVCSSELRCETGGVNLCSVHEPCCICCIDTRGCANKFGLCLVNCYRLEGVGFERFILACLSLVLSSGLSNVRGPTCSVIFIEHDQSGLVLFSKVYMHMSRNLFKSRIVWESVRFEIPRPDLMTIICSAQTETVASSMMCKQRQAVKNLPVVWSNSFRCSQRSVVLCIALSP